MGFNANQIRLEDITPLLKKLIAIPSISGNEHKISNYLIKYLSKCGFETEEISTPKCGPSILAYHSFKSDGPNLLFYGHLDTVEPSNDWKHNPFITILKNNSLYGLGTSDMKGGISALIVAALKIAHMKLNGSLTLTFTSDEELYSRGCDNLIKLGKLKRIDGAISAEPTGLHSIRIGNMGRVVYDLTMQYRTSHALSKVRKNVIADASRFILKIDKTPALKRNLTVLAINSETDFLSNPAKCRLLINKQLETGETERQALTQIRKILKNLRLKSNFKIKIFRRPTPNMKPYLLNRRSKIIRAVEDACLEITGRKPAKRIGTCAGDENYLVNRARIPTVTLGPKGGNEHAPNEYVNLQSLVEASNVYVKTAEIFLANNMKKY